MHVPDSLTVQVPAVLVTSDPEKRIKPAVSSLGLDDAFVGVVSAEDTYRGRPDPEPYLLAAQMMKRPHARCVVVGNSNQVQIPPPPPPQYTRLPQQTSCLASPVLLFFGDLQNRLAKASPSNRTCMASVHWNAARFSLSVLRARAELKYMVCCAF